MGVNEGAESRESSDQGPLDMLPDEGIEPQKCLDWTPIGHVARCSQGFPGALHLGAGYNMAERWVQLQSKIMGLWESKCSNSRCLIICF